jgi:hypothetical protein
VGVSEATVIRFAHYLAYPGYPEFQRDCQQMLSDELERARAMRRRTMSAIDSGEHADGGSGAEPQAPAAGGAARFHGDPQPHVLGPSAPGRVTRYFAQQASRMVDSDVPLGGFGEEPVG